MFTDRFIKAPIQIFDKQNADIIGYNDESASAISYMKLNPFEISHYRPEYTEDSVEYRQTLVYFKSGDSVYINLSISEFEKLLNNFDNH